MSTQTTKAPLRGNIPSTPLEFPRLSGWKSGLQFDQNGKLTKKQGPSRYTKRIHRLRKGTFTSKVKVEDVPTLISIVNAKSEIKQRATAEVVERAKKKEEYREMKARVHVKQLSPRPAKAMWTSVFSSDPHCLLSPSLRKAKLSRGYKPPPGSFKPDWSSAYQQIDLLSPTSGKPKMVAKQDLVLRDKIMSPKKKTHSKGKKFGIPSLDLNDRDDSNHKEEGEETSNPADKPVLSFDMDGSSSEDGSEEPVPRAVTPPPDDQTNLTEKDSAHKNSYHSLKDESMSRISASKKVTKQIILEFAVPVKPGDNDEEADIQVPIDVTALDDVSSVGSWPSIASHDSHDTKMNKMMQRWMSVNDEDYLDDHATFDDDIELEDNVLDHIALAVPDLEMAIDQFEKLTGIRPTTVGPLKGLGVKTAHVGLNDNRFLEILAPDLDSPGSLGQELSNLEKGAIVPYHYSIRSSEVSRLIQGYIYDVLGWDPDHIAMVQTIPDNSIRQWDMLTMYGHDIGGVAPCYVKWSDLSNHPSRKMGRHKATLTSCTVQAPKGHRVHKLISGVGGLDVKHGAPFLAVTLATPKGSVTFSSSKPKGLIFPGYGGSQQLSQHLVSKVGDHPQNASGNRTIDEDYLDIGSESQNSM